jgi:hypothetical protein
VFCAQYTALRSQNLDEHWLGLTISALAPVEQREIFHAVQRIGMRLALHAPPHLQDFGVE